MKISGGGKVLGAFGLRSYRAWGEGDHFGTGDVVTAADRADRLGHAVSSAVWWATGGLPVEIRDAGSASLSRPR